MQTLKHAQNKWTQQIAKLNNAETEKRLRKAKTKSCEAKKHKS